MSRLGRSIIATAAVAALLTAVSAGVRAQEQPATLPTPATPDKPATDTKPKAAAESHVPFRRSVFSGNEMVMAVFNTLASDCLASVRPDVRIVTPPKNGVVRYDAIMAAVERPSGDPRFACNGKRVISVGIFYKSHPGFVGADAAVVDIDFRQGFIGRFAYDIEVR
jgi:hypothetical protein